MRLKVAINVQLVRDQGVGGIQTAITGLISALGRLDDGPEEYVIVGAWQDPDWLQPYIGPNERIVRGPRPEWAVEAQPTAVERLKRLLGPLRPAARGAWRSLAPKPAQAQPSAWSAVPVSDGFWEGLECDVVHFPWQKYVVCALPTVFNPHDLQHLHLPQLRTAREIAALEALFPTACRVAHTVVAGSEWARQDLVRQYGLCPGKVQVIPWAAPTKASRDISAAQMEATRRRFELPSDFAFYPAMTWPHKNHVRLLGALALLRDRDGLIVNLVCTGAQLAPAWDEIRRTVDALGLQSQVRFLGMISLDEVHAIYRVAKFLVVPTLFEGAGLPVLEAFHTGLPVACSSVTSLPEEAGGAALLFDPWSVDEIAGAVRQMAVDPALRTDLSRRGTKRLEAFSWERTAKAYRAVYRRAAGLALSEEDRWLLEWNWMREPDRTPTVDGHAEA